MLASGSGFIIIMKKSFLAVLVILTSGHFVVCYMDTCNYNGGKYLDQGGNDRV